VDCKTTDWNNIKAEYVAGGTSYRKLADKYGVSLRNLQRKAAKESWVDLRQQTVDKAAAKIIESVSSQQARRYQRLQDVTDKLLDKLEGIVENVCLEEMVIDKYTMKQITGALKDIKDIQSIKSPMDIEEQKARIAKLHRDAERDDDTAGEIEVTFNAGPEEWNE
jgi:transposase